MQSNSLPSYTTDSTFVGGSLKQSRKFEGTTTLESSLRVQQTEPAVSSVHCAALCMESLNPHTAAYNQGQGMCQCLEKTYCHSGEISAGEVPTEEGGWLFFQLQ